MEAHNGILGYIWNLLAFFPFFILLLILGIVKAVVIGPVVLVVIFIGCSAVIIGLWPMHVIWTYYCIAKTKNFGTIMKGVLFISLLIPLLVWLPIGFIGSLFTGLGYGFYWPLMATFEAVGEGVSNKFVRCFKDGTWTSVLGGCTIVRDFADVSFHSYFSVMDSWLESTTETPIEIKVSQIPGCILVAILGIFVDVPFIAMIVIYKVPFMLFKGWHRLVRDLIGRSGPFLETVCVPFAGLSILLWPIAVALTSLAGICSGFFLGLYAAAVAYQENSTKSGLLYVIAVLALFDEYTNDFLYLREGSCFPRPRYREVADYSVGRTVKRATEKPEVVRTKQPPVRTLSMQMQELKAVVIWDNFFKGCQYTGRELLAAGAIGVKDLEAWQYSKSNIVNIGIPAYTFLRCFFHSIECGSTGFLMQYFCSPVGTINVCSHHFFLFEESPVTGDNVELTSVNRPEGRVFDWLFEPMSVMKEQIKSLHLKETKELYLYKLCLYCGNEERVNAWNNGGVPPVDEIKSAQLHSISRRLQGFCSMLSRLPSFRRRFHEVVKALVQEEKKRVDAGTADRIGAAV
ncbi:hypothetical protein IFM89_011905 [Coptis chinensis]|uniref:Uncharacterized protein n=1 Tax=Coptis chinensis TaxID=261450 RepID=A0A835I2F9_9MAGN|nr:hypothetical protein IFM89_011905 [Coptis chinensis]